MTEKDRETLRKVVEAVTNLAMNLSNAERRAARRHEEVMNSLMEFEATKQNIQPAVSLLGGNESSRHLTIEATKTRDGEDVSATFHIEGTTIAIKKRHVRMVWKILKPIFVLVGGAAIGWITHWFKTGRP